MNMLEIHCIVNGKVQNVSFRTYVQDSAVALNLVGWVKNCEDGSVELLAQGLPHKLKAMTEVLHEGSVLSKVEEVKADWHTPAQHFDDFVVIY